MEPIVSSFLLVAISEMGNKTQLLAFSLARRVSGLGVDRDPERLIVFAQG